MILNNPKEYDN